MGDNDSLDLVCNQISDHGLKRKGSQKIKVYKRIHSVDNNNRQNLCQSNSNGSTLAQMNQNQSNDDNLNQCSDYTDNIRNQKDYYENLVSRVKNLNKSRFTSDDITNIDNNNNNVGNLPPVKTKIIKKKKIIRNI